MAERRMFAKTIVLSDAFLDMPLSARCLYFTLGMVADDDGFVNNPKSIMRQCGAQEDDMKLLIAKKFVLAFDNGIIVVKHWRINNYLRNDRYTETKYKEERSTLTLDENGAYQMSSAEFGIPGGIPDGIPSNADTQYGETQVRLGKDSIGKDNITAQAPDEKPKRFIPPTVEEVRAYCEQRHNNVDPQYFVDYQESRGWMVGKTKMKDWKAAVRTFERNDNSSRKPKQSYNRETTYTKEQSARDSAESLRRQQQAQRDIDEMLSGKHNLPPLYETERR